MVHLDLFSGIGGFALAVDTAWPGSIHTFCDNDRFCQAVLKKHWPTSQIYGDIRELIAYAENQRKAGLPMEWEPDEETAYPRFSGLDILTGGFPCQPFSQAGRRKGTADDRFLWPEMFRVIQLTKPEWVIAENVRGLVTQEQGMVFEQVCADLESEGYEVKPFIIPACAVNAPHRRDRVWFVAHRNNTGGRTSERNTFSHRQEIQQERQYALRRSNGQNSNVSDTQGQRPQGSRETRRALTQRSARRRGLTDNNSGDASDAIGNGTRGTYGEEGRRGQSGREKPSEREGGEVRSDVANGGSDVANAESTGRKEPRDQGNPTDRAKSIARANYGHERYGWNRNWTEVATELCGVDDGLPARLDGLELTKSAHRRERLKGLGNAIVPQVAIEIMNSIKNT